MFRKLTNEGHELIQVLLGVIRRKMFDIFLCLILYIYIYLIRHSLFLWIYMKSVGLFNRNWSDEEDEVDPGIAQDRRVSLRSIFDTNMNIIKLYLISIRTITWTIVKF